MAKKKNNIGKTKLFSDWLLENMHLLKRGLDILGIRMDPDTHEFNMRGVSFQNFRASLYQAMSIYDGRRTFLLVSEDDTLETHSRILIERKIEECYYNKEKFVLLTKHTATVRTSTIKVHVPSDDFYVRYKRILGNKPKHTFVRYKDGRSKEQN